LTVNPETARDPIARFREANLAWNSWALGTDMALFQVGMSFMNATTVIPTFIAALAGSEVVVGLVSGLTSGAWLLPQLAVASAVSRLRRKKPLMVGAAWVGRPILLVLAAAIWFLGDSHPMATLAATLFCLTVFWVVDAIVTTPWFDLLARAFPQRGRGRVLGTAQIVGGVAAIGGGMVVRKVLSEEFALGYPRNFALLFALAFAVFVISAVALSLIREPPPEEAPSGRQVPSMRAVLGSLPTILFGDRPFLKLVIVRIVGGYATVASAFYVLNATTNLGFATEDTGLFISAQVLGGVAAGLLQGTVQDRSGPLAYLRIVLGLAIVPPALAIASAPLAALWPDGVLYLYLLLYFGLGIHMGSFSWPYLNWILEYAPDTQRPLYIGLINTLAATVMLAPALGGWLVRNYSYPAAFLVAAGCGGLALLLSLSLPNTRGVADRGAERA